MEIDDSLIDICNCCKGENMKVLYLSSNYESVQKHLVSSFNSNGLDAKLLIHMYRYNYDKEQNAKINYTYFIQSHIKGRGPIFYLTKLYFMARRCKKICKNERIELLHGNMMFGDGFICRYISKKLNIPYIVSVRNSDLNTGFFWKFPWIKSIGYKNLYQASAIVFLSQSYKQKLFHRLPEKIYRDIENKVYIIPNGIDDYFLDNINSSKNRPGNNVRIIFVGKINSNKNLEKTIEAVDILRSNGRNVEVVAVGDILDDKYNDFFRKAYIQHIPSCSKEEVCKHLRQADIFVMPSHSESFGLVYMEAMSQGLPVIYTRGQGFDGQFPEGYVGYAVSDYKAMEIAEKIECVIENYEELSKHAVVAAKEFRWKNIADKLEEIYQSVI